MPEPIEAKSDNFTFIKEEGRALKTVEDLADNEKNKGTFIVYLGNDQCGNCGSFTTTFQTVAQSRKESFVALKPGTFDQAGRIVDALNKHLNLSIDKRYPSLLIFKDGKMIGEQIGGSMTPDELAGILFDKFDSQGTVQETLAKLDKDKNNIVDVNELEALPRSLHPKFARLIANTIVAEMNGETKDITAAEIDKKIDRFVKETLSTAQRDAITPEKGYSSSPIAIKDGVSLETLGSLATSLMVHTATKSTKVSSK